MPGRSTIDQIFALRQIIEKCNEHNRTLYIAFLDVKAAFDSIDRISKLINNYRPISLLPVISKVLEKIIANQLSQYFEDNKLFHDNQYGFRTGLSTEYATIELTDRILSNMDRNEIPFSIFLDL